MTVHCPRCGGAILVAERVGANAPPRTCPRCGAVFTEAVAAPSALPREVVDLPAPRAAKGVGGPSAPIVDLPAPKAFPSAPIVDLPAPRGRDRGIELPDLPAPRRRDRGIELAELPALKAETGPHELPTPKRGPVAPDLLAPKPAAGPHAPSGPAGAASARPPENLPAPRRGGGAIPETEDLAPIGAVPPSKSARSARGGDDLDGPLPGLDEIRDDELARAEPPPELPRPRGLRAGVTGPTPRVDLDGPELVAPKTPTPTPLIARPTPQRQAPNAPPVTVAVPPVSTEARTGARGPSVPPSSLFAPPVAPTRTGPANVSNAGPPPLSFDDDDPTPLPPPGFSLPLVLDEPKASPPRAPSLAAPAPDPFDASDLPLTLEEPVGRSIVIPSVVASAPPEEAFEASAHDVEPPSPRDGVEATSRPASDEAAIVPRTPTPERRRPRVGRVAVVAGVATVALGGAFAAVLALTGLGEPLRRRGDADEVARTVARARRLLAADTLEGYRGAAATLAPAAATRRDPATVHALMAQAHLQAALLGFGSEAKLGERELAAVGDEVPASARADVANARALQALVEGKPSVAQAALAKALPAAPGDAATPCTLGLVQLAAGKAGDAIGAYRKALAVEPDRPQALYGIARAEEAFPDAEHQRAALEDYRKVLLGSPAHFGAALSVQRLQGGDPADVELRVRRLLDEKAAAAGPRDLAAAWSLLAGLAQADGRFADAEDRARKALAIEERSPLAAAAAAETRVALARVLTAEHRGKEALTVLEPLAKGAPDGVTLLALAEAQLETAAFGDAGRTLARAEKMAPPSRLAYLRGRLEEVRGGPGADEAAAARYRDALVADPDAIDAAIALSRVLARTGKADEAAAAIAKVEAKAKGDPLLLDRLGEAWLAAGRLDRAEAALREAMARAPALVSARFHLADLLERADRLDEADRLYGEIAASHKEAAGLAERRARLAARRGRLDDARALFDQALLADPHAPASLRAAAAEVALASGRRDDARAQLEQAVREEERSAPAHLAFAHLALAEGRLDDAEIEARRATQLADSPEAELALAEAGEALGHDGDARGAYAAAARSPDRAVSSEARLGSARLLARAGAVKDALVLALALAKESPSSPEPWLLAGDCYEQLAQADKARAAYASALRAAPASVEAAFKVARDEAEAGRDRQAAQLLDRALVAAGADHAAAPTAKAPADAWLLLGEVHGRLGDKAAARAAYAHFLEVARPDALERKTVAQALERLAD